MNPIQPNTKIRILSPEHREYVTKLALDAGFSFSGGEPYKDFIDNPFWFFTSDMKITWDFEIGFQEVAGIKEIFIDLPQKAEPEAGQKHDSGKPRYDLMPVHAEASVVDVLTFGANKYAPGNWRAVESATERYTAAALRHLAAYRMGEREDQESGLPHLAHAVCCLMFMLELDSEADK